MVKLVSVAVVLFLIPIVVKAILASGPHAAYTWSDAVLTGIGMAVVGITFRLLGQAARHT